MSVQGITVTRGLGYGVEILNGNKFVYAVLSYKVQILIKPYIFMKHMDSFPLLQKVIRKH